MSRGDLVVNNSHFLWRYGDWFVKVECLHHHSFCWDWQAPREPNYSDEHIYMWMIRYGMVFFVPKYLVATSAYCKKPIRRQRFIFCVFGLTKPIIKPLPPLLKAFEILTVKPMFQPQTDQNGGTAVLSTFFFFFFPKNFVSVW